MPNISSVVDYFPFVSENTVTMSLGGSISSGATTVPVSGMSNYANGETVVFTVDAPTPTLKQVFTGQVSGSDVVNVEWTYGTNQPHTTGAPVIDYVSATTISMITAGIGKQHNQNGTHEAITNTGGLTTDTFLATGDATVDGNLAVDGTLGVTGASSLGPTTVNSNRVWTFLGYAQITNNFSTTGTNTQITGLTSSVTVPTGTEYVKVTVYTLSLSNGSGATPTITIWNGTAGSGTQVGQGNGNANGAATPLTAVTMIPSLSGSITFNAAMSADAGTAIFNATVQAPGYILVECC